MFTLFHITFFYQSHSLLLLVYFALHVAPLSYTLHTHRLEIFKSSYQHMVSTTAFLVNTMVSRSTTGSNLCCNYFSIACSHNLSQNAECKRQVNSKSHLSRISYDASKDMKPYATGDTASTLEVWHWCRQTVIRKKHYLLHLLTLTGTSIQKSVSMMISFQISIHCEPISLVEWNTMR